jgi:hypothetical protein
MEGTVTKQGPSRSFLEAYQFVKFANCFTLEITRATMKLCVHLGFCAHRSQFVFTRHLLG